MSWPLILYLTYLTLGESTFYNSFHPSETVRMVVAKLAWTHMIITKADEMNEED